MRRSLAITLSSFLLLACSAVPAPPPSAQPSASTVVAGAPAVTVDPLPADVLAIGQPVILVAHATDALGVARIELRAGTVVVQTVTSPTPAGVPQLDAQLSWTPTTAGPTALLVIAYRADGTPSAPATLAVSVTDGAFAGGLTFPPTESPGLATAVPGVTAPPGNTRTPRPGRTQRPAAPTTEPTTEATEPPTVTEAPPEPPPPPPLGDLIIESFTVPSTVTQDVEAVGAMYVKNVGPGATGPTDVFWYGTCPEGGFTVSPQEVPALAAGEQDYVRITFTFISTGDCRVGARIDNDNNVAESNEGNNAVEVAVTSQ